MLEGISRKERLSLFLMKRLCIMKKYILLPIIFTNFYVISQTSNKTKTVQQPLVLQWEVFHPRNRDQISLIFRDHKVELIVNTSSYQKNNQSRLGRFESSMNPSLTNLKKQIEQYYAHLKSTVPLSSIVKDKRFKPKTTPHAPVLRINTETIRHTSSYFKPLAQIIRQVWEKHNWLCVECAVYKRQGRNIVRIVTKPNSSSQEQKKFSKKQLNCIKKQRKLLECIDRQFGIFTI